MTARPYQLRGRATDLPSSRTAGRVPWSGAAPTIQRPGPIAPISAVRSSMRSHQARANPWPPVRPVAKATPPASPRHPGVIQAGVKRRLAEAPVIGAQGVSKVARVMGSQSAPVQARSAASTAAATARPMQFIRTPQPRTPQPRTPQPQPAASSIGPKLRGTLPSRGQAPKASSKPPWAEKGMTIAAMQKPKPTVSTIGRFARSLSMVRDRVQIPVRPQAKPAIGKVRPLPKSAGPAQGAGPTLVKLANPGQGHMKPGPVQAKPKQRAQVLRAPEVRSSGAASSSGGDKQPMTTVGSFLTEPAKFTGASNGPNAALNKEKAKLRKVEEFGKRLLDEWISLSEENKEKSWKELASKVAERVPPPFLAMMAEQFSTAIDRVKEEAVNEEEDMDSQNGLFDEAADEDIGRHMQAMQTLLQQLTSLEAYQWMGVWKEKEIDPKDVADALAALIEAGAKRASTTDVVSNFVVQLTKTKNVSQRLVEHALSMAASRLEDLCQENSQAWHVWSDILTALFPKTTSTSWGWPTGGWTWPPWWQMVENVLLCVSSFRAFEIFVAILQKIQKKSADTKIRDLQVWQVDGRMEKAHEACSTYGEMEPETTTVLLSTEYGIELSF